MSEDRTVQADVRYINPEWRQREDAPRIGSGASRRANTARRQVTISDARRANSEGFGLETSGFVLHEHQTTSAGIDRELVRRRYRPEMLTLVKEITGASQTYMLADLVRTEDQSNFNTAYARFVHCDYNQASLGSMSENLLARNDITVEPGMSFAWFNTWQPFDHVAQQNPLAVLDARSLVDGDIIDYRYTGYTLEDDEGGLVSAPVYNPDHRWYFYPDMTPGEVLLTKQLDGRPGRVRQCPHTSFVDPSRPPDVPPRRSIETRILAVFT